MLVGFLLRFCTGFLSSIDNLFPKGPVETTAVGDTGSTEGSAAKGGSFSDDEILS